MLLKHISPRLSLSLALALCLSSTSILAQNSEENSLLKQAQDTSLKWEECPPFIGEGCQITVLHGDPSKANSDIFFKVPADFKIPNHWHTSAERMILVSGRLEVKYKGEKTQLMTPGAYAYGPAKKPHTAFCHKGGDACVIFIAFEQPIDAFELK